MLRTDAGVVQAGRDGVRLLDLAVLVLHEVAAHAVDDARHAPPDGGAAGWFGAHQPGAGVDEAGEQPGRVGPAADAGDDDVGVAAGECPALLARLVADDPVQLAHHPRVRVRTHHRPQAVVRVTDGGDPVAHRLVDGVLQRPAAAVHGLDLGTEDLHPEDVERLALDVDRPHVDLAAHPEEGGSRGRGHAVLPGAGLGDQAGLAHPLGQEGLPDDVVDLVRAGVVEVLALQQQPQPEPGAEVVALGEDRRPAGVVAQDLVELGTERGIGPRLPERRFQLLARRDQRLGDEAPAELAEPALRARLAHQALLDVGGAAHRCPVEARSLIHRSSRRAARRARGRAGVRRRGLAR